MGVDACGSPRSHLDNVLESHVGALPSSSQRKFEYSDSIIGKQQQQHHQQQQGTTKTRSRSADLRKKVNNISGNSDRRSKEAILYNNRSRQQAGPPTEWFDSQSSSSSNNQFDNMVTSPVLRRGQQEVPAMSASSIPRVENFKSSNPLHRKTPTERLRNLDSHRSRNHLESSPHHNAHHHHHPHHRHDTSTPRSSHNAHTAAAARGKSKTPTRSRSVVENTMIAAHILMASPRSAVSHGSSRPLTTTTTPCRGSSNQRPKTPTSTTTPTRSKSVVKARQPIIVTSTTTPRKRNSPLNLRSKPPLLDQDQPQQQHQPQHQPQHRQRVEHQRSRSLGRQRGKSPGRPLNAEQHQQRHQQNHHHHHHEPEVVAVPLHTPQSKSRSPFGTHKPAMDMFTSHNKGGAPTLFADTKRRVDKELRDEQRQEMAVLAAYKVDPYLQAMREGPEDDDDDDELDPIVKEEMDVRFHPVVDNLSELSLGSASTTPTPTPNTSYVRPSNRIPTTRPSTNILSIPLMMKPLGLSFDSDGSDVVIPAAPAAHSQNSFDDDGDRYTDFFEQGDAFDEAARNRLRIKAPLVSEQELKQQQQQLTTTPKKSTSFSSHGSKSSGPLKERKLVDIDDGSKGEPYQGRLLPTKRKPATPGLSIGTSRSFVDDVEGRLDAIRQKRESKTGVAELGIRLSSKSATNRVVKEKKAAGSKLSKVGGVLLGVFGGGKKEKRGQHTIAPTAPSRAAGEVVKGALQNNVGGKQPSSDSVSENVHKKWFRKNSGSVPSQVSEGDPPAAGASLSGASKSATGTILFGRRRNDGESVQSQDDSGVISYGVVQRMTTFDSAIQGQPTTCAQFAVVEVGEDEDTMPARHILMNKSDVEQQLTTSTRKENTAAFANTGKGLSAIDELDMLVESVSCSSSSLGLSSKYFKKKTKDDASFQKVELSTSFADQLKQMRQLSSIRNKNL